MSLDFMRNIKITKERENYYVVRATTRRFGKNAIMFEGISEIECKNYIKNKNTLVITDRYNYRKKWYISSDGYGHYFIQDNINGVMLGSKQRVPKHLVESIIESNVIEGRI